LGRELKTPHHKTPYSVTYYDQKPWTRMDSLAKQPKHRKMDTRFGTLNVRGLYRIGSLKTVARELGKYKLDLVGVQEVRWEKGGTEQAEGYTLFYGQENGDHQLGTGFLYIRESYQQIGKWNLLVIGCHIILRGRWCSIIILNVHTPCEDKADDVKDNFYEELGHVFDQFPRYDMKILLCDFNAKVGRENIFKPTKGNESLHEISNDNGVGVVNFATSKNLVVKCTMFPHCKIHKYTWTTPEVSTYNQTDNVLIDIRQHSSILDI
jgi:exonuclease III